MRFLTNAASATILVATMMYQGAASTALAGPLGNSSGPLAACEASFRDAGNSLETDARRDISACLTRGIDCLVGATDTREACCAAAHERCAGNLADLGGAKQAFVSHVLNRRCGIVPFGSIIDASGLGYQRLAGPCAALDPSGAITGLDTLSDCLARLVVARTACQIGTREEPRGAEVLACVGLEAEFRAATDADLHGCEAAAPAPTPTPIATCGPGERVTVVASIDKAYAGASIDLRYPNAVTVPGSGFDQSVLDRLQFAANGLTAALDQDKNGDGEDDTLTASLVGLDENPAGPFVTVLFDCVTGRPRPMPSDFLCVVSSASTAEGVEILGANCLISFP